MDDTIESLAERLRILNCIVRSIDRFDEIAQTALSAENSDDAAARVAQLFDIDPATALIALDISPSRTTRLARAEFDAEIIRTQSELEDAMRLKETGP